MVPPESRRPIVAALAALGMAGAAVLLVSAGPLGAVGAKGPHGPKEFTPAALSAQPAAAAADQPSTDVTGADPSATSDNTGADGAGGTGGTGGAGPSDTPQPPVIKATVNGEPVSDGWSGWLAEDIVVRWKVEHDAGSPLLSKEGCDKTVISEDGPQQVLTCAAETAGGRTTFTVSVGRDTTAPAITCPAPPQVVNGSVASLTADVLDATAAPTFTVPLNTEEVGPGKTVEVTVLDLAGNKASANCGYDVVPDLTPPVIGDPTFEGPLGRNGWYVGDVTVLFPVSDPDSVIRQTTDCGPYVVTTDNATPPPCTATSAGGVASRSIEVPRDATPPVLSCPAPPVIVQGNRGSLTAAVSDPTSGPASSTVTARLVASVVGAATVRLTAEDLAGNVGSVDCGYVVEADASAPVIALAIDGPTAADLAADPAATDGGSSAVALGEDNVTAWYVGDVTVRFSASDPDSPLQDVSGCSTTVVSADTLGETLRCSATNSSGVTESAQVVVRRDATPPVVTCQALPVFVEGNPGSVTATFADATSGPATAGETAEVKTSEIGTFARSFTARDVAGNAAESSCPYQVIDDTTPPTVIVKVDGTSLTPGWYTGPVSVTFAVDDPDSPFVAEGCGTTSVPADTIAFPITCRATSWGGEVVETIMISRDSVPPRIICPLQRFVQGANLRATADVRDDTSGVVSESMLQKVDTSALGRRSVSFTATDRAGNSTTERCWYQVVEKQTVAATRLSGGNGANIALLVPAGGVLAAAGSALAVAARRRTEG